MKVFQILPILMRGDAVGNDTVAIYHALKKAGFETAIYTQQIGPGASGPGIFHYEQMPRLQPEDIIIYHMAISSDLSDMLPALPCRKIMVYHNITPPEYFEPYHETLFQQCCDGREELARMRDVFDYVIADSAYNKSELVELGYTCPIDVVPILIPLEDYAKPADTKTIKKYSDGVKNIVFVGRVAPNKKPVDAISAFYYYQKYYNKRSRLILVGDNTSVDLYSCQLNEYVRALDLHNVIFTGKIPFAQILAFYRVADAFLCMSEHEGFCVPLVESMFFDVPIVARAAAAVPETLGNSGIVLPENATPALAAAALNRLLTDKALRENVVAAQRRRLEDFSHEVVTGLLMQKLQPMLQV